MTGNRQVGLSVNQERPAGFPDPIDELPTIGQRMSRYMECHEFAARNTK
jgi:hypothetical protein